MNSPLLALDQSIKRSGISNIFEIEFQFNNLAWRNSPGRSVDFRGLLLWSSDQTTTT